MRFLLVVLVTTALAGVSISARADIKYPTDEDFRAFRNVCAGGEVQSINLQLDAALKTWKANPGGRISLDAARKDLGAVMEKVKVGANQSDLYDGYLACVQNLIEKYLSRMNPALAKATTGK